MEVSARQWLFTNIDSFLNLSIAFSANLDTEPLRKYYHNIEEILNLLKPILDSIIEIDADSDDDLLKKPFIELAQSVDDSIEVFKTWHPLASRLTFVLEAESLTEKIRRCVLEIFRPLKHAQEANPGGLSIASLEKCIQRVESAVCGDAEALISEAVKDEAAGNQLSPDKLLEFADLLGIVSNEEIFIEAVALEKLKDNAEHDEKKAEMEQFDHLIAVVMQFHDHLFMAKLSQSSNSVAIPPDFCCPLSLDLMTDPAIVSTGQTYERAYINKWLGLGLDICPKTRQTLGRTSLTPNYTVKALIASWCEQNNVKLPDPVRSMSLNQPLTLISPMEIVVDESKEDSLDFERDSLKEEKDLHPNGCDSLSSSAASNISDTNQSSGEITATCESALPGLIGTKSHNGIMLRQTSERPSPRIISSSSMEPRRDLSGVENQVNSLMEDLNSSSVDRQREAASELRVLAKKNMENRVIISNCGAISLLVKLLHSSDTKTQENAVTALLNLSLSDNNKTTIASAGAIEPLIHVLEMGTPEAKGNAAATLFSLSVIEENKLKIGRCGAIVPLVDLLANGSLSGKKDATTALYNLSILHENKAKIVEAGAIVHLIELMDPTAGMVDKAVAALANLATVPEGKNAIGQLGGIPVLVEVVELGSARGKENAAATLLQLCTMSPKFCNMALLEGVVPPVVALSQLGTARGKEKAQLLLNCFRNQRHGNLGRG